MDLNPSRKQGYWSDEAGQTFTIEPMINSGVWRDRMWPDGWTAVTADGKRSAQFEHTMLDGNIGGNIFTRSAGSEICLRVSNFFEEVPISLLSNDNFSKKEVEERAKIVHADITKNPKKETVPHRQSEFRCFQLRCFGAWGELSDCVSMKRSGVDDRLGISAMKMKKIKGRRKIIEPRFCFKTMSDVDVLDDDYLKGIFQEPPSEKVLQATASVYCLVLKALHMSVWGPISPHYRNPTPYFREVKPLLISLLRTDGPLTPRLLLPRPTSVMLVLPLAYLSLHGM
ncbi:methionine aminopeptidase 1a [Phtheirospermum japonicum]|uniref:Methionine aminopeptidase 1a n=1 Tax=Phtheirospermum japonicum TaxID=374723 RepID=A0A830C0U0_9LAMI|nr:methionine aminopeptidase 1a [Phtheirospermum japonicum]